MDLEQPLYRSMNRTPHLEHRAWTPQPFRPAQYDAPRQHYDTTYSSDQGPGPATVETTPPRAIIRSRPRFTPNVQQKSAQEKRDCLTAEQTIDLFVRNIEDARKDTQHVLAGTKDVSNAIKPTLTIDLGREKIERLPDAVIDLIITDVERLSLSHNFLRYIPVRIADCVQLRYLNIRSNDFKEIPPSIYRMPLLEILDISKNKIANISPEIRNLESLRVFSIVHNRLTDLPVELAELPRLKVLKVAENPFKKSIKRVIHDKEVEVAYSQMLENERDTALTAEVIKFLRKMKPATAATPILENGELNESSVEATRPTRRALSGRFPVIPAAVPQEPMPENGDLTPQGTKPPSLPIKSHLRGLSGQLGQSGAQRRPGIAPIVNGNERNRSNSESVIQGSVANRQKRMGVIRQGTALDSIDETTKSAARLSHLRGYSHASPFRRNASISSPGAASSSPSSPRDARKDQSQLAVRLSGLPLRKADPIRRPLIEGSKGMLYALYQVYPHISGLIQAIKGPDSNRRSGLEMAFYNASHHVTALNRSLDNAKFIDAGDDESWDRAEVAINNDCAICIKSFVHVTAQMQDCTQRIVRGADPRYVRSLMLLLYGSVVEVKNAIKNFGIEVKHHRRQMSSGNTHPIATIPEESPMPETPEPAPAADRDLDSMTLRQPTRLRSDTVLKNPTKNDTRLQPVQPPNSHIPNNITGPSLIMNGNHNRPPSALGNAQARSFAARSRSNSRNTNLTMNSETPSSTLASTPRSTDSYSLPPFAPNIGRLNPDTGMTDAQEEQRFEQIFMALTRSYESALQAVPITMQQLQRCLEVAEEQNQPKQAIDIWKALVQKAKTCLDTTQALQLRLTSMKLKDSGVGLSSAEGGRHDPSFWTLCKSFLSSFVVLLTEMKEMRKLNLLILPPEIISLLRPVQKACRDAGHAIETSPWNFLFQGVSVMPAPTPFVPRGGGDAGHNQQLTRHANGSNGNLHAYASALTHQQSSQSLQMHYPSSQRPQLGMLPLSSLPTSSLATSSSSAAPSPLATSPMPATPLSAALGPAAQATVPSTPASLYGDSFFKGDVFQRADSLLNMPQAAGVNFLNRR